MRIFLIGFMGSGKSYTGQRLAEALQLPFIDLDEQIVEGEGKSISAIFEDDGEWTFRNREAYYLRKSKKTAAFVMASGGGTPLYRGNLSWMKAHGLTIFLDVSLELITARLLPEIAKRPLLKGREDLQAYLDFKLQERRPTYEKAAFQLLVDNPNTDPVRLILDYIKQLNDDDPTTAANSGPTF